MVQVVVVARLFQLSILLGITIILQFPVPTVMAQINNSGSKRSMKLAGGWRDAKVSDPDVLEAAAFCLQSLQTQSLDSDQMKPDYSFLPTSASTLKIIQATKQVVAGINYALTVMVLESNTCVGVFKATVYNRFGELSVTKWSEEITCTEGTLMVETDQLDQNGDSN